MAEAELGGRRGIDKHKNTVAGWRLAKPYPAFCGAPFGRIHRARLRRRETRGGRVGVGPSSAGPETRVGGRPAMDRIVGRAPGSAGAAPGEHRVSDTAAGEPDSGRDPERRRMAEHPAGDRDRRPDCGDRITFRGFAQRHGVGAHASIRTGSGLHRGADPAEIRGDRPGFLRLRRNFTTGCTARAARHPTGR